MLWGGRNTANKYHWHVWGVVTVSRPHWVCPLSQHVCFCSLHCWGSRLLCWELSATGLGLHAFPTSKPLRFRFLRTPQRCRLGWAWVLCSSLVWAAQVTRCLVSTVAPSWGLHLIASPIPAIQFSGCTTGTPSQGCCMSLLGSWSLAATLPADVDCPESQEVSVNKEGCLQFGRRCLSGTTIAPFQLWLPLPACLWWGMGQSSPGYLCSVLFSVSRPGGVLG